MAVQVSDMNADLMARIPVVASRTEIGRGRLEAAQSAVGLSNEQVATLIPVSERTWRRWKDAGRVPTYALPQIAKALNLELREVPPPPPTPFEIPAPEVPAASPSLRSIAVALERLLVGQQELAVAIHELEKKLDVLLSRRPGRRASR